MRLRRCQHLNTRCIHGDEINAYAKIYIIRYWKDEVVYRQLCLDCGKPLDRDPLCEVLDDPDIHEWNVKGICACSIHDIERIGESHAPWCPMYD